MEIFELGEFELTGGAKLTDAKLGYTTHGRLSPDRDNAILFANFLGGAPEALEAWIGEGRPLDPTKYFIILPGHFGLPPTSAPSNTPPPYSGRFFPPVHIADDVLAQRRLLTEQFGIEELQLVLGWSVGALQTYEWAVRFPQVVKRMAPIAGGPEPGPWGKLWLRTILQEPITFDPEWKSGSYTDVQTLEPALRRLGRGAALTLPPPGFYTREVWRSIGFASVDDFIARFWEAYWLPQDPNDIIAQAAKATAADPSQGGDMGTTLGKIEAKTSIVAFTGDPMFQPERSKWDADHIPGARYLEVPSEFGHLATFSFSERDRQAVDDVLRALLAD